MNEPIYKFFASHLITLFKPIMKTLGLVQREEFVNGLHFAPLLTKLIRNTSFM